MSTPGFEAADSVGADDTGAPVVDDAGVGNAEVEESTGGHPAWKEILDTLPTSLHPVVTPALEKWDHGVQERFQQVQSRYEPYKDILESELSPEEIQRALTLQNMLAQDPRGFYERMGGYFGQGEQESEEDAYEPDDDDEDVDPRVAQLAQSQEAIAAQLRSMMEKEATEQAEAELSSKLDSLKDEHGEFDEEFVINYAIANGGTLKDIDKGFAKYQELVGKIKGAPAPGSNLPQVVAPGGATPSTQIDPASLDKNSTQQLVVSLLQKANEAKN